MAKRNKVHEESTPILTDIINSTASWPSLTVWRKSPLLCCTGFQAINSDGNLVFRVDNYSGHPHHLLLMDGSGNPLITLCRPKGLRGLIERWRMYEGELVGDRWGRKPIWCVRKHLKMLNPYCGDALAYIYMDKKKRCAYKIEGSYTHRCCRVLDHESGTLVAEIKIKESFPLGVSFGFEVFRLIVRPGFDHGFAMAIVVLLDQMFA
ncbi:protein LURP-one-related 17 [Impatiens glandulifera]|uniref:protein LURP-one-related 17 n=1 Tax=Impatiens glandulifera TaxID=253017 RepID=UPI001FB05CAE|nr:protein LURP-one-related 17 [Impatiens glandulifera]